MVAAQAPGVRGGGQDGSQGGGHDVASAPTQAKAYELVEAYSGPDAENLAAWDFRDVEENYRNRYNDWLGDAMTMDEVYDAVTGANPARWGLDRGPGQLLYGGWGQERR